MRYFKVNEHYAELKLPFDDVLKEGTILDGKFNRHDTWGLTFIAIDELIDKKVNEFFNDIGMPLKNVYFMYGPANKNLVVHVDGYVDESGNYHGMLCGLNYIYGSTDHVMRWFTSNSLGETSINKEGLKRTKWYVEDCELARDLKIVRPTLVRTDVPHDVVNLCDEKRFCVSLRFRDQNMSFDSAREKLSRWII